MNANTMMQKSLRERSKLPVHYPTVEELSHTYGPELAAELVAEIEELDAQLDTVWPGWRKKAPFSHLPFEPLKRTQWLLKRRQHIIDGNQAMGIQFVFTERLRTTDGKLWPRCFSVPPPRVEPKSETTKAAHYGAKPSAPHLAAALELPLERVEAALAVWDPKLVRDAREHVRAWHKANPVESKAKAKVKAKVKAKAKAKPTEGEVSS